jgi:hypothetical protein
VNEKKKTDLWALMCPTADQLLAEALAKTDEEVAESLEAKGYDLTKLDAELFGLLARLPPRKSKRRGFLALSAAVTLGVVAAAFAVATPISGEPAPSRTAASPPPQDSASKDAGWETVKGPSHP